MRAALFATLSLGLLLPACGTNQTPQPEDSPSLPNCLPNRDGEITVDELPIAIDAKQVFYASPASAEREVALGGTAWDLSEERADDLVIEVGPVALRDQWYASELSRGQFVVDAGMGLDGIYHQDDQGLWLDAIASQAETPRTLIEYAQPLPTLRFPVRDGDRFETTVDIVDSTVSGLPFVGTDTLAVEITGDGVLDVPYVEFSPVMRVRTLATRRPSTGTPVVSKRTTIFLFECFGEIARAESRTDEPSAEFTRAAYLRRFALGVRP